MKRSIDSSGCHRAAVLRRERYRLTLERVFGWRLSALYQRVRTSYRRWRHASFVSEIFRTLLQWHDPYRHWVREESRLTFLATAPRAEELPAASRPTVSILVPVEDPHVPWLEEAISSVRAQQYPHWELLLCLVHASPEVVARIEGYQSLDERIKYVCRHESTAAATALNAGLEMASGEFLGFLRQHDTIAPYALSAVVRRLEAAPVDIVYSDEDLIDADGRRSAPFFKPDWSPDLCLSGLYACRFAIYRRALVMAAGGIHPESIDSLEYDLLLRCTEQSDRIAHIPLVLYHKRHLDRTRRPTGSLKAGSAELRPRLGDDGAQETVHTSAKRVLAAALARRGENAEVVDGPGLYTFRVRRRLHGTPLVSILIPTRDQVQLLQRCVHSIEQRSTYRQYEILIIDNGSREPETHAYLRSLSHRVIHEAGPFNFARLNNRAAALARGDHLLLLNNDTEVISPDWLQALLEHSQRAAVGAVGGQLLYADGAIQHAGVVLGVRGIAGHAHKYLPVSEPGYHFFPHLIRNYSAVTAACLMIRKRVYEEVGGMDEHLAVTFNDVDLCLRLRAYGYLIVYTPYAQLYHHESRSRWSQPPRPEEVHYMLDRWGPVIARDPYYNPNLALDREDFRFDGKRARATLIEVLGGNFLRSAAPDTVRIFP